MIYSPAAIPVFYDPRQSVADSVGFSPSAGKPGTFVRAVEKRRFVRIVADWEPLTVDQIAAAHDRNHVTEILSCREANGFGNHLRSVADSLPWTTGSFFHAARHAVLNRTFAVSPTSGFHHATYGESMMFCTFNGLMIAAILLSREGLVGRIGVVDFDAHFGNGTAEIIHRLDLHYVSQMSFAVIAREPHPEYDQWLNRLPEELEKQFAEVDLILYQAGADCHVEDPLGGQLTTEQMYRRDQVVFAFARDRGIPLVWNLAGGYQEPLSKVIVLHCRTLEAHARCLARPPSAARPPE
ncbi:MAG: hypothetical protein JW820_17120 [Spirochaetales bacterium]|nr:hypothetical protein [Spirochaetales bacterium]